MPRRNTPLVSDHYYHILNRGNNRGIIFQQKPDYKRAMQAINYYRFSKPILKMSSYLRLSKKDQQKYLKKINQGKNIVDIICFCFMPNHTHLLLKQISKGGISKFMSNWQNSYARYFNIKYKRKGYLFESSFKAKIIQNDKLLWHISRYIHLNPSSSSLVSIEELEKYPWSSFLDYLGKRESMFTNTKIILNHFKGRKAYKKFVFNQAAYQKKLQKIKQLLLD